MIYHQRSNKLTIKNTLLNILHSYKQFSVERPLFWRKFMLKTNSFPDRLIFSFNNFIKTLFKSVNAIHFKWPNIKQKDHPSMQLAVLLYILRWLSISSMLSWWAFFLSRCNPQNIPRRSFWQAINFFVYEATTCILLMTQCCRPACQNKWQLCKIGIFTRDI